MILLLPNMAESMTPRGLDLKGLVVQANARALAVLAMDDCYMPLTREIRDMQNIIMQD